MESNKEPVKQKAILFSTRDIVEAYPNNLGLQKTLREFIHQVKFRSLKTKMVKIDSHRNQIRVAYYSARKLKVAFESYIESSGYKLCGDRKKSFITVLDLIKAKIEKETKDDA